MRQTKAAAAAMLTAFLAFGTACDTYHFLAGTWQEDSRHPAEALKHYEAFLADLPRDPRACEVRLRAAAIDKDFGRCEDARRHWEAAARDFPGMPACADRARLALLTCPDYFPLDVGRTWVYVDSASQGKAARIDWEVRRSSGAYGGAVQTTLYAGNKRIREAVEEYVKDDWAVWRADAKPREPLLRFPFSAGQSWTGLRGKARKKVEWTIVAADQTVKVAAGTFSGCLKVRERDSRYPKTWRFDYYCPDVGRVKTTVGGPGFENPNTELLRFDKMN